MIASIFKAILGWVISYKWAIISVAALSLLTTVGIHFRNDTQRKADLAICTDAQEQLELSLLDKEAIIISLNAKVIRVNAQLTDLVEKANARVAQAEAEAKAAKIRRDLISSELAQARFDLEEAMKNDSDFANWSGDNVPVIGWLSLRKAASGTD